MSGIVYEDIADFAAAVRPMTPLIGLDPGTKTIGLAVSDSLRSAASSVETVRRKKFSVDVETILALAAHRGAGGYVVGLPRNMDGSEGPRAQSARAFARNLAQRAEAPVALWDERLSTVAAERALLAADMSRKKRAEVIDSVAAAYILQGALDRLAHLTRSARQDDADFEF